MKTWYGPHNLVAGQVAWLIGLAMLLSSLSAVRRKFYRVRIEYEFVLPLLLVVGMPVHATCFNSCQQFLEQWTSKFDGCLYGLYIPRTGSGKNLVSSNLANKNYSSEKGCLSCTTINRIKYLSTVTLTWESLWQLSGLHWDLRSEQHRESSLQSIL